MPAFDTPRPISVSVELIVGDLRVVASDRADTVVEVQPTDPASEGDVAAAARTTVEYSGGQLVIKAPKGWRQYSLRGGRESIDVQIELPAGSNLQADASVAALRCTGRLGECRYKTSTGDISVDQASSARLRTGAGDISVDRAAGHSEISTGAGAVWIGAIDGTTVVKNSKGDIWVGSASGDLRLNVAAGSIAVGRSQATVGAKTANGDVRLREIAGGTAVAETGFGQIDIGIPAGVAAWLDLNTRFGHVQNTLEDTGQPMAGQDRVEVRARTSYGDITVTRPAAADPAAADPAAANPAAANPAKEETA